MRSRLTQKGLKLDETPAHAVRSIALTVVLLLGTTLPDCANAQTPSPAGHVTLVAWPAPVGHRQPRIVDIPAGGPALQPEPDMLDRSLSRKLTICRGC
jgi:hypothetical protein